MKRIAILGTRGIPARYGGFETFAEEISARLVTAGIDVTVFCQADANKCPQTHRGVKLIHVPAVNFGPLTTIFFDLRCLWRSRKSFDIVYMLGYGAAPFCVIPRLWKTKVWLNVDGIEWKRAKWNSVAKAYFKLVEMISLWAPSRVIADSEGIREHLRSRHFYHPKCSVIPYGAPCVTAALDVSTLSEWGLETGGYYLIVCRLEPENHIKEIIEGHKASSTSRPLVIVGNHELGTFYVESLLKIANDKVRFIGEVYVKEKLQCLRHHCLAYFHGHSVGGTNPSLLEAMGCGNIVIAHDNTFNREVAGELGFYFISHQKIPTLIKSIELLTDDQKKDLGNKARARIHEKYNWDSIVECYLNLIKEDAPQ